MEVCIAQCVEHADILDFNLYSNSIDGQSAMGEFMCMYVTEPTVARLSFMTDSFEFAAVEEGLKWCQGKSIVNPISLQVGEELFIVRAMLCK